VAQMQRNFEGESDADLGGSPHKVRELRAERDMLRGELQRFKTQLNFAAERIQSVEEKNVRIDAQFEAIVMEQHEA